MKTQIKEVQDYFKNKLLSNDFKVARISEYTIDLVIDSEYKFCIWTANTPKDRRTYESQFNFMDIPLTDEESIKFDALLSPTMNKWKKETLLIQKKEELDALEKELSDFWIKNNLNN